MPNQIINISPTDTNITGLFRDDNIIVVCDTTSEFTTDMPDGYMSRCYLVSFHNVGEYSVNIDFSSKSMLHFFNGYVSSISIGAGGNMELFNEPVSGKWRGITDPSVRLIWEDNRLKGQVYQDGTWHTCIKGGY